MESGLHLVAPREDHWDSDALGSRNVDLRGCGVEDNSICVGRLCELHSSPTLVNHAAAAEASRILTTKKEGRHQFAVRFCRLKKRGVGIARGGIDSSLGGELLQGSIRVWAIRGIHETWERKELARAAGCSGALMQID